MPMLCFQVANVPCWLICAHPAPRAIPNLGSLVEVYTALLLVGGQAGLPIVVLTFLFSKNVHRHPTFVNFCITIIIYSIVFSLLIYSGQYRLTEPNKSLCIAQASMIMGILPMVCVAGLAAVIQLWATFQDPGSIIFSLSSKTYSTIVLLVMPYLAFLGYTIAGVIVGSRYPKLVKPSNGIYCFHKINAMYAT
ncbi:hypothetical protein EW146_g6656 [Bondarzewia mesenterica]|uniref:G-protein coupled receptors family 3 profile domain-containing protein n=1 Tax=Bondarzewia mesenterica TaxID=1095465 RepID=A0A4S4LNL3_9AGAM|nr:hypothetical protein EW146_g6656 [Bondarzewia mesenterica]